MCESEDTGRGWLVGGGACDGERNVVGRTYATADGEECCGKERALTSLGDVGDASAAVEASRENLGWTAPEGGEAYAAEARRMAAEHDPGDVI